VLARLPHQDGDRRGLSKLSGQIQREEEILASIIKDITIDTTPDAAWDVLRGGIETIKHTLERSLRGAPHRDGNTAGTAGS
jgi:hypothetical protein